tara:strand:+ start:2478 stop:2756 length:279 start_codon:yes stop_codon:yes gene_type:complete
MGYLEEVSLESLRDHATDSLEDLEESREVARAEMIQALLADVPVILDGQKWTLEELLIERMEFTDSELDNEVSRMEQANFQEPDTYSYDRGC